MPHYYGIGPLLVIGYHAYPVLGRVHEVLGPLDIPPPAGFRKGQRFPLSTLHEDYVVGVGQIIYETDWARRDEPDDFTPQNYVGFYEAAKNHFVAYGGSGYMWYWRVYLQYTIRIPPPPPRYVNTRINNPPPTPQVPSVPLTQFDTFGRPILYSAGARRIAGAKIWALELVQGDPDVADPAVGSWAEAFGYPLFPDETFYINRLWGDGQLIFVSPNGPDVAEIADIVEGFEGLTFDIYYGTESQLPCPTIANDKGTDRTPAFRGLIYIVLKDIELQVFGNRYPSLSAEFLRTADDRIAVADVLERVGELGGVTVQCEGIDDMADGVVFEALNPRSILQDYREQYNYRIIDGDPIRLVRRPSSATPTVDFDFNPDRDLVSTSSTDEVSLLERREDSELPNEVNITFAERIFNYQTATQYARRPHFPIQSTHSEDIIGQRTDFIITAVEALSLAYDMLYLIWTRRLTANFTVRPEFSEIQEADVVRLPTPQGTYLFDITHRSLEPNQDVQLEADCLLAESGVEVTADSGQVGRRIRPACYFPQMCYPGGASSINTQIDISGDGRLWHNSFCQGSTPFYADAIVGWAFVNKDAIPTRVSAANIIEALPPNSSTTQTGGTLVPHPPANYASRSSCHNTFQEGNYFYRLFPWFEDYPGFANQEPMTEAFDIQRINKETKATDTMHIPPGMLAGTGQGEPYGPTGASALFDGKIYFSTPGRSGPLLLGEQWFYPCRFWWVDVDNWAAEGSLQGFELAPVPGSTTGSTVCRTMIVCNIYIVMFVFEMAHVSGGSSFVWRRIYRYNTSDGAVDHIDVDHTLGQAAVSGDYVYFLPDMSPLGNNDFDSNQVTGAKFNVFTMAVEFFDITDDTIFGVQPGTIPWVTQQHFCFLADQFSFSAGASNEVFRLNSPRLCRRELANVQVFSSLDLVPFHDVSYQRVVRGIADDTWHYLTGEVAFTQLKGQGMMLRIGTDFSGSAILTPYTLSGATKDTADNDMFANAFTMELGTPATFYNEFATKEAGEPNHGNPDDPGGRSLWWTFTAAADDYYTVSVAESGISGYFLGASWFNFGIYSGTLLTNLIEIWGFAPAINFTGPAGVYRGRPPYSFPIPAGEKIYIAIDGPQEQYAAANYSGPFGTPVPSFGTGAIKLTRDFSLANDNFANAFTITPGQTQTGRNRFATKEAGEPNHAGNVGGKSMWWKFTPTVESVYSFDTNGSDFATLLAVYTADNPSQPNVDAITEVGGSGQGSGTDDGHISAEDWAAWMIVAY